MSANISPLCVICSIGFMMSSSLFTVSGLGHRQECPQCFGNLLGLIAGESNTARNIKAAARNTFSDWARHVVEKSHFAQHRLLVHRPEERTGSDLSRAHSVHGFRSIETD